MGKGEVYKSLSAYACTWVQTHLLVLGYFTLAAGVFSFNCKTLHYNRSTHMTSHCPLYLQKCLHRQVCSFIMLQYALPTNLLAHFSLQYIPSIPFFPLTTPSRDPTVLVEHSVFLEFFEEMFARTDSVCGTVWLWCVPFDRPHKK